MKAWILASVLLAGLLLLPAWMHLSCTPDSSAGSGGAVLSGTAGDLRETVVVPTPHARLAGRNVLWCGTFQLAWNEVCALVGEDLHFAGPEPPMVARLNRKEFGKEDLDEASYVAIADFVRNDVHARIRRAVREKFGDRAKPKLLPDPALTSRPQDIVAYAYLLKSLKFATPFEAIDRPLTFDGTKVACFGLGEDYRPGHADMLETFRILAYEDDTRHCIVELLPTAAEDRILLAKVPPAETLAATVAAEEERIAAAEPIEPQLGDVLKVPKMSFDITRTYGELLGRRLVVQNPDIAKDLHVLGADQRIRFEMNEKGVELESESSISFGCSGSAPPPKTHILIFDEPFLILLQRTGAARPYFALWVDNAELLLKAEEAPQADGG